MFCTYNVFQETPPHPHPPKLDLSMYIFIHKAENQIIWGGGGLKNQISFPLSNNVRSANELLILQGIVNDKYLREFMRQYKILILDI